jgi:hypothetical protein
LEGEDARGSPTAVLDESVDGVTALASPMLVVYVKATDTAEMTTTNATRVPTRMSLLLYLLRAEHADARAGEIEHSP